MVGKNNKKPGFTFFMPLLKKNENFKGRKSLNR